MKVYEAVFREGETEGVYALSVVEDPAMQDLWIALSEHPKQIELATIDEEKRLLLGAALIPNKKIYRKVDEEEFFITFNEETIEKLAHAFISNGNQNNSSLEHQVALDGMSVVENWIVENPQRDKSTNFGKQYPKGTWVTMMKVDNDEIWDKVKQGEIKGFSIDALLGLQEIKFNTEINMTKQDFLDQLKSIFTFNEETPKEEVEQVVEEVEVKSEEVVEEVTDTDTPQENAELEALKELIANMSKEQEAKLNELRTELTTQVEEKDKEIETLKTELAKEPEVEPIKAKPEVKQDAKTVSKANSIRARVRENLADFWQ